MTEVGALLGELSVWLLLGTTEQRREEGLEGLPDCRLLEGEEAAEA